jgi:hypothetical protein
MALPTTFNTILVENDYVDLSGAIGVGTVTFEPVVDGFLNAITDEVMVIPKTMVATVDPAGHMSITLPFTNDPDVVPTFTYRVTEQISGKTRSFNIELVATLIGPVKLSKLAPVGASSLGTTALTKAMADALYAPLGTGPTFQLRMWPPSTVAPTELDGVLEGDLWIQLP